MKSHANIYRLCAIGVLSAMVFVANFFSIPLPFEARVHFGNVFCVLSGLLLGPVSGGLCAGLGGFFYDLTNPIYAAGAPVTFLMKFVIGFVAGVIAFRGGRRSESFAVNLTGAAAGSIAYVVVYLAKNFIEQYFFLRNPMETVTAALIVKGSSSLVNAVVAVVVSMLLRPVFLAAMRSSGIVEKLARES